MVKIKDIFGSIIIFLIFAMPMILISDMCVVNIKNYDYININETVNATYSNDDISNLTKSRNTYYRHKYYFYDENGNTVSIELYGPKQRYYGRTQHEYKYVIDDTLGDTVTVKDVTIIPTARELAEIMAIAASLLTFPCSVIRSRKNAASTTSGMETFSGDQPAATAIESAPNDTWESPSPIME